MTRRMVPAEGYCPKLCEQNTGRTNLFTLRDRTDQWTGTRRKITSGRSGVNKSVRS